MRETERQTDRLTDRQADRHRQTEIDRQTKGYRTRGQDGNNQTLKEKTHRIP